MTRLPIIEFLSLSSPIIDVRSPGEFRHAHIPGAISIPLFLDDERAAVGTAYKQESREQAIKLGLDYFGPKMRSIVESVEKLVSAEKTIRIYCWRGGMRSGAVAWLLDLYGFKVYTLHGGYKTYRRQVLSSFEGQYQLKLLGGYTGSGKTKVLEELRKHGEAIIDLERLAAHKGSAFGNIGMPEQPSQEMFENLLYEELKKNGKRIMWVEDESQRIGHINLPNAFWQRMRESPVCFLDIPFEERLEHIVQEYGELDRERMMGAIGRISKRLGSLEANNAISLISEGKTRESFRILLTYYDRWYLKGLHNRPNLNALLHKLKCDHVTPSNAKPLLSEAYSGPHPFGHSADQPVAIPVGDLDRQAHQ